MKKVLIGLLALTATATLGAAFGCAQKPTLPSLVVNGGFESGDLSGWTVEYGDAYNDDSVSSRRTFSYSADIDPQGYVIPVNQTGNWYLSGRGFDNTRPATCTGAIRSSNFVLGGDGTISMKLAGGAQAKARSDTAEQKPAAEVCYVGVYRASDNKMIARQTNRYFAEDASNIKLEDYISGTCYTDNFCEYKLDLSDYIGEELYLRVVDNDTNYYYGYLSVDDIRVGKDAEAQSEGAYFTKTHERKDVSAVSVYDIANGDFEAGSLAGWEVSDGLAFSDDGVNCDPCWWAEQISYERDGNFHYGYYNPKATGRMRSTSFIVGGSGYVTYKLGGCSDNSTAYLRFMKVVEEGDDEEVLRVSNFAFKDMQFPNVANGMRVINLNQYRLDLSSLAGERLYIEVVDENASDNMAGCVVLDSVKTYYEEKPQFVECFDVDFANDITQPAGSEYQIENGGFETGDISGWELSGDLGEVCADDTWWAERLPFNKTGKYLFSGMNNERGRGTLTSSQFTVGGECKMTFSLGGAHDPRFCYVSLIDERGEEVARYGNYVFHDAGLGLINKGSNLANMVSYCADLSEWRGQKLRVRITDNGETNWGLVTADNFITYYEADDIDIFPANCLEAINIKPKGALPKTDYQIENGNFELDPMGTLKGWTLSGNIGNISYDYIWWNEWYTFNKEGTFFFSGFAGNEGDRGTLTSSEFTVWGEDIITYRLGGGMNPEQCYLEVVDADDPAKIYFRFANSKFSTQGGVYTGVPVDGRVGFGANMVLYKADLSALHGKKVKLRLVDDADRDWGLLFADDFVTYYAEGAPLPAEAVAAENSLPEPSFEDVERTMNLAYPDEKVTLAPRNGNAVFTYAFSLAEEYEDVVLEGNEIKIVPSVELNKDFAKKYEITVKVTITNTALGKDSESEIKVTVNAMFDNRRLLNGDFETGDLTGWTVVSGNVRTDSAISGEETFWGEGITYNKSGNYFFDGERAQYAESEQYALRSSKFLLDGSGFISFKMGGRAAVLKVYKADGEQIAEYDNTGFANVSFPHVDEGCRLMTMTTFVADLSEYKGQELYIEICDGKEGTDFGLAIFDNIITYYETAPDTKTMTDTVRLNSLTSSTETECDYGIKWMTAENKIKK